MDAITQTLTLAIILLIVGLACMVIGIAGLVWMAGRNSRRSGAEASIPDESYPLIPARPRNESGHAKHRDEVVSSHLPSHPS